MSANEHIRYEPDEAPPLSLTLIVAFQGMVLIVSNTVMITTIFAAAFNDDGTYLAWAIFAGLIVAGAVTALQATRLGRLGSGHILLMGPGVPFLAVCVLAVDEGGLALMSSLVVASSLMQFAVAAWLARLRRLITPVVAGVAFMMIAVSAMPIAIGRLNEVPDGASTGAGPAVGLITLGAAALLMLRGTGVVAPLGTADLDPGGLRRRGAARRLRRTASARHPVVRPPGGLRVAGLSSRRGSGVLGPAAGVPGRKRGGRRQVQ
ncbi:MAG: hypothetical protein F4X25_02345 [Chloroflexi bacterium]|nr:hypothetical protein [Chloroflexota bacterium]